MPKSGAKTKFRNLQIFGVLSYVISELNIARLNFTALVISETIMTKPRIGQ